MPSKEFQEFMEKIRATAAGANPTIQQIRQAFEKMMTDYQTSVDNVFEPISTDSLYGEWYHPSHRKNGSIILFFHAGFFSAGSAFSHRDLVVRISQEASISLLNIDYRLAAENPFPAALDDAEKAYRYLLQSGYSSSQIFLAGLSSSGGLVLSLLHKLKNQNEPMPRGIIALSPWLDLTLSSPSIEKNQQTDYLKKEHLKTFAKWYYGEADPKDPFISPLFGSFKGYPPIFLQIGSGEIFYDETKELAKKMQKEGVEVILDIWDEMPHAWMLFAKKIPEGREAIKNSAHWIKSY